MLLPTGQNVLKAVPKFIQQKSHCGQCYPMLWVSRFVPRLNHGNPIYIQGLCCLQSLVSH